MVRVGARPRQLCRSTAMFSLSKLFAKRSAKREFARARSEFEAAAAALVATNRSARASGKMLTPEMESAGERLDKMQEQLTEAKFRLDQVTGGPPAVGLTEAVSRKVHVMFPVDQQRDATHLLEKECGRNLLFNENADPAGLERVRLAVLKLSGGNLEELKNQIGVAKVDWRDVLISAETPEAVEFGWLNVQKLDAESRAALKARDKKQYDDWLRG